MPVETNALQDELLRLLDEGREARRPKDLFQDVRTKRVTRRDFRRALWQLVSSRQVDVTRDNRLLIAPKARQFLARRRGFDAR